MGSGMLIFQQGDRERGVQGGREEERGRKGGREEKEERRARMNYLDKEI